MKNEVFYFFVQFVFCFKIQLFCYQLGGVMLGDVSLAVNCGQGTGLLGKQ
jgi:hypothetical protein